MRRDMIARPMSISIRVNPLGLPRALDIGRNLCMFVRAHFLLTSNLMSRVTTSFFGHRITCPDVLREIIHALQAAVNGLKIQKMTKNSQRSPQKTSPPSSFWMKRGVKSFTPKL